MDVILVSDTQVKPDENLSHIDALAHLTADLKPDVVAIIGDWWDFPSLSQWDTKTIYAESQRYRADCDAGNEAKDRFMSIIKRQKKKLPRFIFTEGNHEDRVKRYVDKRPELHGSMSFEKDCDLKGWEHYGFTEMVELGGVWFSHYHYNPMTGKPFSGNPETMIKNIGYSFVMGHQQRFAYARRDLGNGEVKTGLIAGAYYPHDERYKGPQGNHHWRGVVHLKGVDKGYYDFEKISIERILNAYS